MTPSIKAAGFKSFMILALQLIAHGSAQTFREQDPCYPIDESLTYTCPVNRYCAWMNLNVPNRNMYKNVLFYTRRSWDYQGRKNSKIENTKFANLTIAEQDVLKLAGFDEESHLCCHGHYLTLDWAEISDEKYAGPKAALELIGYDESNWGVAKAKRPYDDVLWADLPEEVQSALTSDLCYNRELWDGVDLTKWTNETAIPGAVPTVIDESLIEALATGPVVNETEMMEIIEEIEEIISNITTFGPTASPTITPTESPTASPSESPTSSPTESPTGSPTDMPTTEPTLSPTPSPTVSPSIAPTEGPTDEPTSSPVAEVTSASSRSTMKLISAAVTVACMFVSLV